MDFSQFHGLGWATAAAVAVITAMAAIVRNWRDIDAKRREYEALKRKFEEAVDSRDLDLAASIAQRMRHIERALGGKA